MVRQGVISPCVFGTEFAVRSTCGISSTITPNGAALEVGDHREGGVRDKDDLAARPGVLEVGDDLGHDPARIGVAMDRANRIIWLKRLKFVSDRFVDQLLCRLDEEDLLSVSSKSMSISCEGISFARPRQGIEVIHVSPIKVQNKARKGWRHLTGKMLRLVGSTPGHNCPPVI